jgi:hypothetical protein
VDLPRERHAFERTAERRAIVRLFGRIVRLPDDASAGPDDRGSGEGVANAISRGCRSGTALAMAPARRPTMNAMNAARTIGERT